MTGTALPHFVIKNKFQKGGLYEELLTPEILSDVCLKVTGQSEYTCTFDNSGYNIGRLAVLDHQDKRTFISFSEAEIRSRNSSFQSFPSALSRYILDGSTDKELCFYFLPDLIGNYETPYFIFMYRLMKTARVNFLNAGDFLENEVISFSTPEDIIVQKDNMRSSNSGNKSTYITRSTNNHLQIFGKTYGANKYETTLICLAISEIADSEVELHEIEEGGLTQLPKKSKEAIESLGIIKIYTSNRTIERIGYEKDNSLRSSAYTYNLLEKFGDKKCAFCECEIPQIIQGAHIWPVASIKKEAHLTLDEKLNSALDGNNGLWLCQNHHKLLDSDILLLSENGSIKYKSSINETDISFINDITVNKEISNEILNDQFLIYLNRRNQSLREDLYCEMS